MLWLHLFILSGVISPLISNSILGTYQPGRSSFSVLSFCLFIMFMGFSRQEYRSGLPFPSPVDHILSGLSTVTCLSWVALHGMVHSFIELDGAVVHVIRLASFHSVCPLMEKDKKLMEVSWWDRLTMRVGTGSCSDGQGHAQEIFNPIFCWCVELCSLPAIYLEPNYGAAMKRYPTPKVRETQVRWQVSQEGIRGQTHWNHTHRKLVNLITLGPQPCLTQWN